MIRNEEELRSAFDYMKGMYRILASLRTEVLPVSSEQFALFAEGPFDEIRRVLAEINEYTGFTDAARLLASDAGTVSVSADDEDRIALLREERERARQIK
jgi:hypothetical protein